MGLKQLEQREILPEDYDLLGRLDESVKPRTLEVEEVHRFPVQVYRLMANATSSANSTEFGFDYWRLPLPLILNETDTCSKLGFGDACTSADFWRLPLPA